MASLYSLLCAALLILAIVSLYISPAVSTSRRALEHRKVEHGFRVTLRHVDSGKNLTKWERIQRGIKRGNYRMQRLYGMGLTAASDYASEVETPVTPGDGEFLMDLAIGTPPKSYSAILDTGSDLIWTQCKPCSECFKQPTPIFDPKKSKSFSKLPCSSYLCAALPQSSCSDGCEYLYAYGDYSSTQGFLAAETFTFGKVSVPKIGFGCGGDNQGSGFSQGAGLVGLGRGPLSLVSQLKEPKFSYCLTSIDNAQKSTLMMGSQASVNKTLGAIKTTPLIKNPTQPAFYYLSLKGITIGDTRLPYNESTFALSDDGTSGGLIIDSGTTITYIETRAFHVFTKEFTKQMNLPYATTDTTGLDICFDLPSDSSEVEVPKLIFHFDGADLDLPPENYMIADASSGVLCLTMGGMPGMSIFGNVQQQNMLVLHDLEKETVSFQQIQCDKL